jgi:hypothetical protein
MFTIPVLGLLGLILLLVLLAACHFTTQEPRESNRPRRPHETARLDCLGLHLLSFEHGRRQNSLTVTLDGWHQNVIRFDAPLGDFVWRFKQCANSFHILGTNYSRRAAQNTASQGWSGMCARPSLGAHAIPDLTGEI